MYKPFGYKSLRLQALKTPYEDVQAPSDINPSVYKPF